LKDLSKISDKEAVKIYKGHEIAVFAEELMKSYFKKAGL
jgi:hypothetical protein